mgnify:CR=1 FL=1
MAMAVAGVKNVQPFCVRACSESGRFGACHVTKQGDICGGEWPGPAWQLIDNSPRT